MKTLLGILFLMLLIFPSLTYARGHNYFHRSSNIYVSSFTHPNPSIHPSITPSPFRQNHIQKRLQPVNNSGIAGIVDLIQLPNNSGTHITVLGFGLKPGNQYVSLYYGNHTCALEPYSVDDVIGGVYTANQVGVGSTQANQEDNLADINSISIRNAGDFKLLACADIHP